jgi:glutamate racemase
VFDSGIGGLTVLKELVKSMPHENFIYFGDIARAPYGSRPPAEIMSFMHQTLGFFATQQVKMAVFACNAMTSVGFERAKRVYPFPLVAMNSRVKAALKVTRNKNIGVIATRATVASGRHGKAIRAIDACAAIYPQACPKFVPLIENGQLGGAEVEAAALEYLLPLKDANIDTLILACTHYPFLEPVIRKIMGPDLILIDPAGPTSADTHSALVKNSLLADERSGSVRLCFSAKPTNTEDLVAAILGGRSAKFEEINLQDYVSGE